MSVPANIGVALVGMLIRHNALGIPSLADASRDGDHKATRQHVLLTSMPTVNPHVRQRRDYLMCWSDTIGGRVIACNWWMPRACWGQMAQRDWGSFDMRMQENLAS